jgi:HSP20 family protein
MLRTLVPFATRMPRLLADVDDDFGRTMERFFGPEEERWGELMKFNPRTNLAETDKAIEVTIELPGMKAEEFHVDLKENELWITGEKKEEKEEKGKTFHRVERRHGEFRRVVPLPAHVDREKIEAVFKDGLLKVTVAKPAEAARKAIPVKA